jgi:CDP-diacylglycerol---serine O-phosphatidyltransferase
MNKRAAVPSLFTICNLLCGFLSIVYAVQGRLLPAAWLIVIAAFLDAFDGKLARLFKAPTKFGVQFDSLADVCSFGVAPAFLMVRYFDEMLAVQWLPFAISFLFLLCGALRLARFNTQLKGYEKEDFTGLPIPAAAVTLAAFIVFTRRVWESTHEPQVAITLCVMLAFYMISSLDYPAFPKFTFSTRKDRVRLAVFLVGLSLIALFTEEAFFPLILAYSLTGPVTWLFHLIADRETADIQG